MIHIGQSLAILLFSLISIILYLATVVMLWRSVCEGQGSPTKTALLFWLSAMLIHSGVLVPGIITPHGIDLSLFNAISLSVLLITLILFILCLRHALSAIGIIVLQLAAISVVMAPIETSDSLMDGTVSAGIQMHIISSLLAYALLITASIQALVIHRQINYLKIKDHSKHPFISTLPTLDAMESFLFVLIKLGIVLLTISLVSGWLYHEDLLAQHLMHKTVLSAAAWLIFSAVLIGKWLYGWRTKTAVSLILIAAILLILAYLGSKFVLEVILDRI